MGSLISRLRRQNSTELRYYSVNTNGVINLSDINPEEVKSPPFKDEYIEAYVVDVLRGDIITVLIHLGSNNTSVPFKINVKLDKIVVPSFNNYNSNERAACIKIRDFVGQLIVKKIVKLKILEWDLYSPTILVELYLNDIYNTLSLNHLLLERGYAKYNLNNNSEIMWGENDLMYIITGSLDYSWRSYV